MHFAYHNAVCHYKCCYSMSSSILYINLCIIIDERAYQDVMESYQPCCEKVVHQTLAPLGFSILLLLEELLLLQAKTVR